MALKKFCDKCKKEIELEDTNRHPYFDSTGRILEYCKSCNSYANKIEKKYRKIIKGIRILKDKELMNIKPKPWWKF